MTSRMGLAGIGLAALLPLGAAAAGIAPTAAAVEPDAVEWVTMTAAENPTASERRLPGEVQLLWERSNGNNIAQGSYVDSGNRLYIDDQEKDGHSALAQMFNRNTGKGVVCWDFGGAEGPGGSCDIDKFVDRLGGENAPVKLRLCYGEGAKDPKDRVVLKCQSDWTNGRV